MSETDSSTQRAIDNNTLAELSMGTYSCRPLWTKRLHLFTGRRLLLQIYRSAKTYNHNILQHCNTAQSHFCQIWHPCHGGHWQWTTIWLSWNEGICSSIRIPTHHNKSVFSTIKRNCRKNGQNYEKVVGTHHRSLQVHSQLQGNTSTLVWT